MNDPFAHVVTNVAGLVIGLVVLVLTLVWRPLLILGVGWIAWVYLTSWGFPSTLAVALLATVGITIALLRHL